MTVTNPPLSGTGLTDDRPAVLQDAERLRLQGKYAEAIVQQQKALAIDRDDAHAHLNLGAMQMALGLHAEAIDSYGHALLLQPDFMEALYSLGIALRLQGDHVTAIYCNRRVLELDPLYIDALDNLCDSYIALKNYPALAQAAMQSISLNNGHANGFYHLGIACIEQGDLNGGRAFLERAAVLNPANNNIANTLGLTCLACGDLQAGWAGYERRWFKETAAVPMQHYAWPWWQGQAGQVIFVWGEQGIGDQIMLASMLGDLVACSRKVIFACAKKLMPLMQRSFPEILVLDLADRQTLESMQESVQERIEVQCALGSLARYLRPAVTSFARADFLRADPLRVAYWEKRLATMGAAFNVGICWRSGNMAGDRQFYSAQIGQWQEVFAVPGIRFINLQYDECSAELDSVRQQCGITVHDFSEVDLFDDLDETAALTSALDLVISAPTAAGILTAALGVPAWVMISGFYWQQFGTEENAWYRSLVSIRRNWDQPWEEILKQIAERLRLQASSEKIQ